MSLTVFNYGKTKTWRKWKFSNVKYFLVYMDLLKYALSMAFWKNINVQNIAVIMQQQTLNACIKESAW